MNYEYLINLIIIINLILTFSANIPIAGRAFRKKLQPVLTKANSYLQSLPKLISSLIFLLIIAGLFGFGRIEFESERLNQVRVLSAIFYIIFSWIQIYSIKQMNEYYSPDIVIYKNHKLIEHGLFKYVRHPIYVSQILQDIFAGFALLSIPVLFFTILVELPLYIGRTNLEESYLEKNLITYFDYKKRVGKWLPKFKN